MPPMRPESQVTVPSPRGGAHHLQRGRPSSSSHAARRVAARRRRRRSLFACVLRGQRGAALACRPARHSQPAASSTCCGGPAARCRCRTRSPCSTLASEVDPGLRRLVVVDLAALGLALERVDEARLAAAAAARRGSRRRCPARPACRASGPAAPACAACRPCRSGSRPSSARPGSACRASRSRAPSRAISASITDAAAWMQARTTRPPMLCASRRIGCCVCCSSAVEELAEALAQHVERLAPVVGKALDAVARREVLAQLAVGTCRTGRSASTRVGPQAMLREPAGGDVEAGRTRPGPCRRRRR